MNNKKIRRLLILLLAFILVISGNSLAEVKKLADLTEKTETESKVDMKSFLFNPASREILFKHDEMRRRFLSPLLQKNENPPTQRRKMHEITLLGSYMIFMGNSTVERSTSDLFTGMYSPWFGRGYENFYWSGPNRPKSLDNVIGAAVVTQKNVFLWGFKFAINFLPRFQIELVFKGGESVLEFDDDAWEVIDSVIPDSVSTLMAYDRQVSFKDLSEQSSGDQNIFGMNINFNILDKGPIIPYVSLGFLAVDNEGFPKIEYELAQYLDGLGEAKYNLIVGYDSGDESFVPNFGLGTKIFLGKNLGIKVETRAAYNVLTMDQIVATDFDRDSWMWLEYGGTYEVAATQKINRFIIDGGIGLFFRW